MNSPGRSSDDKNETFSVFERLFVVATLFLLSGALLPLLLGRHLERVESSLANYLLQMVIWVLIYTITTVLIFKKIKNEFISAVLTNKILFSLILLALFSTVWSEKPLMTLSKTIALVGTTLFGVYISLRFSLESLLSKVGWALGISILVSIIFTVIAPSMAFHTEADVFNLDLVGSFRGAFAHKNSMGIIMSLSAVLFLFYAAKSDLRRKVGFFFLSLVSIVMVYYSRSKTAIILIGCLVIVAFILRVMAKNTKSMYFVIISLCISSISLIYLTIHYFEKILDLLGGDITLTGRLPLWILSLDKAVEKPWVGYGFGAFWTGWSGPCADIWKIIRWEAPHAHNGFIDVLLSIGAIGLLLFIYNLSVAFARSFKLVFERENVFRFCPIIFLLLFLISNLTESSILSQNSLLWTLYVSITIILSRKAVAETD